nr:hypothetical protein [uncultured Lichenicoccus sp.]
MTINWVMMPRRSLSGLRLVMGYDLMSEKIKLHPGLSTAAFRATHHLSVEMTSRGNIVDGKGDMERRKRSRGLVRHGLSAPAIGISTF